MYNEWNEEKQVWEITIIEEHDRDSYAQRYEYPKELMSAFRALQTL